MLEASRGSDNRATPSDDRKRDTYGDVRNMDLVRSIQERWDRGDFTWVDWADTDIELQFENAWEGLRPEATEFREVDSERVLVLIQFKGRAKASGMRLGDVAARNASVHAFATAR